MVFEFPGMDNFIEVTAQYSNAVLVALLPYFSDFAHRLSLPVPNPITATDIVGSSALPWLDKNGGIGAGGIMTKAGYGFRFNFGHVNYFVGPHSYYSLQNPDDIPKFYGKVRMSKDQAVTMARNTIKKLGIPLEDVFAEQEPHVTLPVKIGTNTVPHYRVVWSDIWPTVTSVDIEIDANTKRVEEVSFGNLNLHRPSPKVAVTPEPRYTPTSRVNPEYARKLLPIVLRAVDDYGETLSLRVPRPLNTNHVERFILADNGGWPSSFLRLSNGWWFAYRNSMVNGFYAPGNLTSLPQYQSHVLVKNVVGKWNLTETQAIQLVARTLAKLNYPSNLVHIDFAPRVGKPAIQSIPRYAIRWDYTPPSRHSETEGDVDFELQSKVEAEVDAEKGELKALYYDDKAYWHHPPAIDVPISLPTPASNRPPDDASGRALSNRRPSRPQSAFNPPVPR